MMVSRRYIVKVVLMLLVLISTPILLSAQQTKEMADSYCFATVAADSRITLSTELSSTVPDVPIAVKVDIQNISESSVPNATLYIQVFDLASGMEDVDLVDEFVAAEGLEIGAGETVQHTFVWRVPYTAEAGTYRISAKLLLPGQPYLSALASLRESGGAYTDIAVVSDSKGNVAFDRSGVFVEGKGHAVDSRFVIKDDTAFTLAARIKNDTSVPHVGKVAWRLYAWDARLGDEPIDEDVYDIQLHVGRSAISEYEVHDTEHAAYYLKGEFSSGASRSLIAFKLVREGARDACAPLISSLGTLSNFLIALSVGAFLLAGFAFWRYYARKRFGL